MGPSGPLRFRPVDAGLRRAHRDDPFAKGADDGLGGRVRAAVVAHFVEIERPQDGRPRSLEEGAGGGFLRRGGAVEPVLPVAGLGVADEQQILAAIREQNDEALVVEERVEGLRRGVGGDVGWAAARDCSIRLCGGALDGVDHSRNASSGYRSAPTLQEGPNGAERGGVRRLAPAAFRYSPTPFVRVHHLHERKVVDGRRPQDAH